MNNADTISVIMACHNCEATLERALDSILEQTYSNWFMICCDDGSDDRSYDILLDYKRRYPDRFLILHNEENKHLPYSLNRCLEYVTTDLVARMDGDDQSLPERFEKQLRFLREHPECDLVGTGVRISNGSKIIGEIIRPPAPEKEELIRSLPFSHATIMTYKRVYDQLGGYSPDPSVLRVEDLELWFRFFAQGFCGRNLTDMLYMIVEDRAAIKKRTLRGRINGVKVCWRGYRMLGFRKWVYLLPLVSIVKGLLPIRLYQLLHTLSLRRTLKQGSDKR